jgi:hypothetical protein
MNKVIVAGSRTVRDREFVFKHLDRILADLEPGEIVTGLAKGPDTFGKIWGILHSWDIKEFPADWSTGRSAGYRRNERMAKYATHLVAFWDGSSKGTKHMIDLARRQGLEVRIIRTERTGQ